MGLMALNLATWNVKRLIKLGEFSNLSVNFAAVQETHFTCAVDRRVQENDCIVLSVYSSNSSVGVSLLIGCRLNADVNLVLVEDWGWLVVAEVLSSEWL